MFDTISPFDAPIAKIAATRVIKHSLQEEPHADIQLMSPCNKLMQCWQEKKKKNSLIITNKMQLN